jgi:hypothetical protein
MSLEFAQRMVVKVAWAYTLLSFSYTSADVTLSSIAADAAWVVMIQDSYTILHVEREIIATKQRQASSTQRAAAAVQQEVLQHCSQTCSYKQQHGMRGQVP